MCRCLDLQPKTPTSHECSSPYLPRTSASRSRRAGCSSSLWSAHEAVRETKKQLILKALDQAGGSYADAAKLLGTLVNYLHRLIPNLDLKLLVKREREGSDQR